MNAGCPLWVKSRHIAAQTSCLLYPRKRTFQSVVGMPAKGRKRTFELYSITPTSALWTFMPKRLLGSGTVFFMPCGSRLPPRSSKVSPPSRLQATRQAKRCLRRVRGQKPAFHPQEGQCCNHQRGHRDRPGVGAWRGVRRNFCVAGLPAHSRCACISKLPVSRRGPSRPARPRRTLLHSVDPGAAY